MKQRGLAPSLALATILLAACGTSHVATPTAHRTTTTTSASTSQGTSQGGGFTNGSTVPPTATPSAQSRGTLIGVQLDNGQTLAVAYASANTLAPRTSCVVTGTGFQPCVVTPCEPTAGNAVALVMQFDNTSSTVLAGYAPFEVFAQLSNGTELPIPGEDWQGPDVSPGYESNVTMTQGIQLPSSLKITGVVFAAEQDTRAPFPTWSTDISLPTYPACD